MPAAPKPVTCRPVHSQEAFGINRATLYRWAKDGHINIYKKGPMSFVKVDEVPFYIEQGVG
ncbi:MULTISPECIES: hypothetical protein [unclassified Dinoroseobacter]|uniref:hypothetical protein n=1 Tax=unclassified Dinoroseobacter TaxID=2620028 RepID=UPI003C7E719F